ncbi:hypothetical protein BC829DRAFT_184783 [Chytridium lagenaria]|nr:hypothetical protein BC829DRAFT_184783 [Chytridium lagenaria]
MHRTMSCCFRLPKRKTAQQLALSSANTFLRSSGVEKRKRSSSTITKSDIVVIGSDAAFRIDPARLRELASVEPRREEKEENQQEEEEKVCVTGVVEGPLNIIEEDEEEEGGRGSVGSFGNRGSVSGRTRETEGIQRRARGEASPYLRKKTSQVNLTILDGLLKGSLEVVKTFASTAMQTDGDESGVKDGEGGEKCGSVDSVFPESAVDATPMAKEILGRAKSMNARRGSVGESRRASLAAGQDKDDKIAAVMKLG